MRGERGGKKTHLCFFYSPWRGHGEKRKKREGGGKGKSRGDKGKRKILEAGGEGKKKKGNYFFSIYLLLEKTGKEALVI